MSGALTWIGVGLLGGAGALARFLLDGAVARRTPAWFPFGILAVNVSGSVLLGLLTGLALRGDALLLAGGALLGSYTTFSTWMRDSHGLAVDERRRALAVNLLGSLALGLAGVALGRWLGGLL
jgi:CrcB protein